MSTIVHNNVATITFT